VTFRILASQMRSLGRQTQSAFVAKMEGYLTEHLPAFVAGVGPERLTTWVAGALAVAHAHDIHSEPEAAQLILLLTVLGLDADQKHDWVREALTERMLPTGKLTKLVTDGCQRQPAIASVLVYPAYQQVLDRVLAEAALVEEGTP
jgi:hypothetical protein